MVRPRPFLAWAATVAAALLVSSAFAQTVTFNGRMGERALLVVNGQPRVLAVGESAEGVKFAGVEGDAARVEVGGKTLLLRPGTPITVGHGGSARGNEIVLFAGSGGHFVGNGSINGKTAQFVVDTGATNVSFSTAFADQAGIPYRNGNPVLLSTANGVVQGWQVSLNSVRVGDVEVFGVEAVVSRAAPDIVLLGNSFLSRFTIQVDGQSMHLTRKF